MTLFTFILFSCFVGIAFARTETEIKTWFLQQGLQCAKEFPVTDQEILMMEKHQLPESRNGKCLMACMFRKADWMDEKGMFIEENAVKMSEQDHAGEPDKVENAKKLFDLCKKVNDETITGADSECERAAQLAKCLTENAPKMGFKLE